MLNANKWGIALLLFMSPLAISKNTVAATVPEFVTACNNSSNVGEKICQCVGENAQQDLSPQGFEMLIATLNKDEATTEQLRAQLPYEELIQVGLYMVNQPNECAQQLGE